MTSEGSHAFARKLEGFPGREPRLDEQASAAHGLPLESLAKVRKSQSWHHLGEWLSRHEVQEISSGRVEVDDDLAARLGIDGLPSGDRQRTVAALQSRHLHRVDLLAPSGNASLDIVLNQDGFAGWADPGQADLAAADGEGSSRLLQGERKFISGPWSVLPRLVSSWAGLAPAWAGWPPLKIPGSVIDSRLDRSSESGTEQFPPLDEAGEWWLLRLSGAGLQAEPWLISERIGCMAITGEPGDNDVTLVQVNGLSVFTSIVSYWDAALTDFAGGVT